MLAYVVCLWKKILCVRDMYAVVFQYRISAPIGVISYTESYRDLQQSYRDVQQSYRTRNFELECSISAPVRSSVHRNGTHPTLKTCSFVF